MIGTAFKRVSFMTDNKIISGTNTLTDNWLLQSVAQFLAGNIDRSKPWGWVSSDDQGVYYGQIKAGAFQINCLVNILEQILFSNNIYVMKDWVPQWYDLKTDLNLLYLDDGNSIIKEYNVGDKNIQEAKERWLKDILHTEKLKEKYYDGMKLYAEGKEDFWSQVINGVAEYISLSTVHGLAYAPHSARAGFLKSTLWYTSTGYNYPQPGIHAFNKLINAKRLSISERRGYDSLLVNLNVQIPSGALLCIQKSSDRFSPIAIALQLRNEPEIKAVRTMLHELSSEIAKKEVGELSNETELVCYLEDDIDRASELLKIPKSIGGNDKCGNQILRQFNYRKYVEGEIIHKGNVLSHSGILMDLIDTGSLQTRTILENKLRLKDHQIVKQLIDWSRPDFFKRVREEKWMKEYSVYVEINNRIISPKVEFNMNDNRQGDKSPWISGSFYLLVAIIVVAGLAVISNMIPWYLLPIIIVGGVLIIGLIGILQLRNDEKLKDESFVSLIGETYKRLPLLFRRRNKENNTKE